MITIVKFNCLFNPLLDFDELPDVYRFKVIVIIICNYYV